MCERYDVRLPSDKVEMMRQKARILSVKEKQDLSWVDLLRRGMDMVLADGESRGR